MLARVSRARRGSRVSSPVVMGRACRSTRAPGSGPGPIAHSTSCAVPISSSTRRRRPTTASRALPSRLPCVGARDEGRAGAVDLVAVGRDLARHQAVAPPAHRLDQQASRIAGVAGEGDPGHHGFHQGLHEHRHAPCRRPHGARVVRRPPRRSRGRPGRRRTTSSVPRTPRMVRYWPAKLAPSRSSAVEEDRTARAPGSRARACAMSAWVQGRARGEDEAVGHREPAPAQPGQGGGLGPRHVGVEGALVVEKEELRHGRYQGRRRKAKENQADAKASASWARAGEAALARFQAQAAARRTGSIPPRIPRTAGKESRPRQFQQGRWPEEHAAVEQHQVQDVDEQGLAAQEGQGLRPREAAARQGLHEAEQEEEQGEAQQDVARRDLPEVHPPPKEQGEGQAQAQEDEPGPGLPAVPLRRGLAAEGRSGHGAREHEGGVGEEREGRARPLVQVGSEPGRQPRREPARPQGGPARTTRAQSAPVTMVQRRGKASCSASTESCTTAMSWSAWQAKRAAFSAGDASRVFPREKYGSWSQ